MYSEHIGSQGGLGSRMDSDMVAKGRSNVNVTIHNQRLRDEEDEIDDDDCDDCFERK